MSTLRSLVFGCVSHRSSEAGTQLPSATTTAPHYKIKFGVPLSDNCKNDRLPVPLVEMLVYIAKEGVTTTDLFRRPGNITDAKVIIKKLSEGKEVPFTNYNFYTLASVVKKFLLRMPGGVLGPDVEQKLLKILRLELRMEQYEEIRSVLSELPNATQHLLALLFGTWFRIVNHSEYNAMSSEAVAKSVAGSLFHTCSDDPKKVEKAVQVMQILIDDFGVANMFGRSNIQYFADATMTGIRVQEKFKYEYQPSNRDSISYEQSYNMFGQLLLNESSKYGFDISSDAITEDEFYGHSGGRPRASTKGSSHSHDSSHYPGGGVGQGVGTSAPPSPKSLQPPDSYQTVEENGHKKLNYCSSLSAPEVNQGCCTNGDGHSSPRTPRMYQCNSLTRCDTVKRRQIIRMKKRSNWFLAPTAPTTANTSSSSSTSTCGARSLDGRRTSSDVMMADPDADVAGNGHNSSSVFTSIVIPHTTAATLNTMTTSTPDNSHKRQSSPYHLNDISSINVNRSLLSPHVDHHHHGSDVSGATHSSMSSSSSALTPSPCSGHQPNTHSNNSILSTPDYVNGNHHQSNHGNSSTTTTSTLNNASKSTSPMVTERDVRYFMVENWYGTPVSSKTAAVTPSRGS